MKTGQKRMDQIKGGKMNIVEKKGKKLRTMDEKEDGRKGGRRRNE